MDLARGEIWKRSLEASRTRRAAAAIARRRRLRKRGGTGSLLAAAMLTGVLGAGMAVGHEVANRPAAQAGGTLLKVGSSGQSVSALQRKLGGIAVDGIYGPQTRGAVRTFQRRNGLMVDGIAGPQTLGALGLTASAPAPGPAGDSQPAPATERGGESQPAPATGQGDGGNAGSGDGGSGGGSSGTNAELQRIAQCESGGNPNAVSRDGRYRGKYQFDRATWRDLGGSGDPAKAPEAEQDQRAQRLYEQRGSSPWGACS